MAPNLSPLSTLKLSEGAAKAPIAMDEARFQEPSQVDHRYNWCVYNFLFQFARYVYKRCEFIVELEYLAAEMEADGGRS